MEVRKLGTDRYEGRQYARARARVGEIRGTLEVRRERNAIGAGDGEKTTRTGGTHTHEIEITTPG